MRPGRPTRATSSEPLQTSHRSPRRPPPGNENGSGASDLAKSIPLAPPPQHAQERRALGTPDRTAACAGAHAAVLLTRDDNARESERQFLVRALALAAGTVETSVVRFSEKECRPEGQRYEGETNSPGPRKSGGRPGLQPATPNYELRHAPRNDNTSVLIRRSRLVARTATSAKMAPRWWPRLVAALLGMALGFGLAPGFGSPARAQDDERTQEAQDRSTSATSDAPAPDAQNRRALANADAAMRKAAAQGQFERAEALRAAFEAKSERERSVRDYENLLSAYRRVYLITPNAVEVPPAIKRVGDLYRRMGEQFETRYFDLAIRMYEYLSRDYPESSLREPAMMAIAEIRKNNLSQPEQAQKSYEDFLAQYPHSSLAPQARKAIAEIQAQAAAAKSKAAAEQALAAARLRTPFGSGAGCTATTGSAPARPTAPGGGSTAGSEGGAAASRTGAPGVAGATGTSTAEADPATPSATGEDSQVSRVRIWNADNYTRIIIELGGKAKYQAARISDPDRIYFDIENAKLSTDLLHQPIEVPPGSYLKAVRVAQNRSDRKSVV